MLYFITVYRKILVIRMRPPVPQDRVISDMLQLGRESQGYGDLLSRFSDYLKSSLDVDKAVLMDASRLDRLRPADEVALNTRKPYIDNGLSDYSAFNELIEYYNSGFRCCAIVPLVNDGKALATITLLSKDEKGFGQAHVGMLALASGIVSIEASYKYERDKSLGVARYFDASFNNAFMQFIINEKGGIVKANKAAMSFANRLQGELEGADIGSLFAFGNNGLERLRKGYPVEVKGGIGAPSISTYYLVPSRVNEGLMHVAVTDVGELRNAEGRAGMLDNASDDVFLVLDQNLGIEWASANIESVLRINSDAVRGRKLTDFIVSPIDIGGAIRGAAGKRYVGRAVFGLGNDVEFAVKVVAYGHGSAINCIIARDYDKRVEALERAAAEIMALSNDPMVEINGSGYIMAYNRAAENLFGLDKGAVGTPIYAMCADSESQNKIVASLPISKANGAITDVYVNLLERRDRSLIPCVQTIKPVPGADGTQRFLIIMKELATKRRFQELLGQLEKAQREVEKLKTESDLKSQFIYNISHDLKTPITNIMGFSKIILTDYSASLTKEQRDYIQIIYDESERFLQLVKQILDVAKLSSGIVKLDTQDVDLNGIRNNPSITALEQACHNKGLSFDWTVDYDVPQIPADPNRMIQVFSNLISNAIKFTERGGISIKISKKRNNVVVQVSDTGIGISKEDRAKIFRKFFQLRRGLVKQEGAGTGLGLSIVREIVHLHGGEMRRVESEPGKGSTFSFTMPLSQKVKKRTARYNAEHQDGAR